MVTSNSEREAPWIAGIEGEVAHNLIQTDSAIVRVIAGPGTGKTTCLKRRILRLIQRDHVIPETIFVGTFTRAIAKELEDALGTEIRVATLHSIAYGMLRRFPSARQGMNLRFLLKCEEEALLYDIGMEPRVVGDFYDRREMLRSFQASLAERVEYDELAFTGAVRRWLTRHRAMLIGDVVHLCLLGLEGEDIPRGEFNHVVVDEYQDLTAAEQELVRMIWSRNGTLTVMGDDNQSIYGFRYNHPSGIQDFHLDWTDCEDLHFSDNRRCGRAILDLANEMMLETGSANPPMVARNEAEGEFTPVQWETLDAEIEGIGDFVRRSSDESFLVLVPRRFIGYRLADAIGSDARTAFSEEVLEHRIAQEAFITASMLADPEDFAATRTFLGFDGSRSEHAPQRNASAFARLPASFGGHQLIRNIANGLIGVSGVGASNIEQRALKAVELLDRGSSELELIDLLFDENLADQESDDERKQWLKDNLNKLRDAAQELMSDFDEPNLARAISTMRYRISTSVPLTMSDDPEPRVRIMTLHSAKGLEADNVVLAGVADQFLPGRTNDPVKIAEQKRLLYVGVTRARERLIVSWPRRIRSEDVYKNFGRQDNVITIDGARWAVASRSRLLPQRLIGTIRGDQLVGSSNVGNLKS